MAPRHFVSPAQYLKLSQTPSPHEGRAGGDPTDSSPQQPSNPPPTTSHPTESTPDRRPSTPGVPPHQKSLPRKLYVRESDMYAEHVELLNSVSRFFQANKKDVNEAWLPAQPPRHDIIPTASQNAGPPLNRVFQDTHNLSRSFSIIDFGLSHLKDPTKIVGLYPVEDPDQEIETIWANCRPHHHITGTLPFVAFELLKNADYGKKVTHALHHDLESVFWVLLYTCIKHHEGRETKLGRSLGGLTSPDPYRVRLEKTEVLMERCCLLLDMGGKFWELAPFLRKFAELCKRAEKVMEAFEVEALVSEELQKIRKKRMPHGPAPATKKNVPSDDESAAMVQALEIIYQAEELLRLPHHAHN